MRVAVVGAGFAGLACAADLAGAGVDVTVFEARARVGGRAWSEVMSNGTRFERGGEFVETGYDALRRRAAEHGLALTGQGFAFAAREVRADGRRLPALLLDAEQTLASTVRALGAAAGQTSAAEALERASLDPLARRALLRRLEGTYAVALDRVSAAWLSSAELRAGEASDSRPSARLAAGNDALAKALARQLGNRVRVSCAVRELREEHGALTLRADDGVSERYERAVLAAPLPLALALVPALRARASYARLVFGVASKLHVPLIDPAGPAAVQGLEAAFWTWTASAGDGGPATIAAAFAGGSEAHTALEIGRGSGRWRAALWALRPELALAEDAVLTSWGAEPMSAGSYACHPPGWSRRDDEEVAAPCGRVHLAGEHTAAEFCGTLEGALRSGARAAAEVLSECTATSVAN
jgi:monoamine oxidase